MMSAHIQDNRDRARDNATDNTRDNHRDPIRDVFRQRVVAHGGSRVSASALGCSRSYIDMIIKGDRRPGLKTAHAIELLFGIPMQAWVANSLPRSDKRP